MKSPMILIAAIVLFAETAAAGGTVLQNYEAAKLKAQGKLQLCVKKKAADVVYGKPDTSADCVTKFYAGLDKVDAKATSLAGDFFTPSRFVDKGDGTIEDLDTGLQWEKKVAGSDCLHCVDAKFTILDKTAACSSIEPNVYRDFLPLLNNAVQATDGTIDSSQCLGGHCDWRLPSVFELWSIKSTHCIFGTEACIDPAFLPTAYPSSTTVNPSGYWDVAHNASTEEVVSYYDTFAYESPFASLNYVRAVRAGLGDADPLRPVPR
jgi:hypothetical protein